MSKQLVVLLCTEYCTKTNDRQTANVHNDYTVSFETTISWNNRFLPRNVYKWRVQTMLQQDVRPSVSHTNHGSSIDFIYKWYYTSILVTDFEKPETLRWIAEECCTLSNLLCNVTKSHHNAQFTAMCGNWQCIF